MNLDELIVLLRRVPGAGCPATFRTPDGKTWTPDYISSFIRLDQPDPVESIVFLKEVPRGSDVE